MTTLLKNKFYIVIDILIIIIVIDQWTKMWAVDKLKSSAPIEFMNEVFQLIYAETLLNRQNAVLASRI